MSRKTHFVIARFGLVGFMLASLLPSAMAVGPTMVVLSDSTRPVEAAPPTGTVNPQKAFVSRQTLTAAETNTPLEFEVALKMRNFADLQARVSRCEHISLKEMADKYEPAPADYQSVVDWLKGEGFTVTRSDSHHMAVFVRGKIGHIAQTFQVNFARVKLGGQEYSSAITAPSVPGNLSPLLVGINGLQPHLRAHKHLIKQQLHPNASSGNGSYIPSQLAQAYSATGLYNMNITGAGQTIAIVIDTFPAKSDLISFWQTAGVNQSINNVRFIQVIAGSLATDTDSTAETTLDTEWGSSIAPGAQVRVYAALDLANSDLDQAYEQVYTDVTTQPQLGIHQMSMSYGEGEKYSTNAQVQTDDQYFAELTAAGVTLFASSGDGGATPGPNGAGDKSGPLHAETPATDPNVTGVGGTTLKLDSNNNETSETVWNNSSGASGGGASIYFTRPTWQTGSGVPAGTMRDVPDVACSADPDFGALVYIGGSQTTYGGTSWASPTWAGFCALINQARANADEAPVGLLGPNIYPLLGSANYVSNIRDIISGNNATTNSGSTNGVANYTAGVGYDLCSGIGVPLVQALSQTFVAIPSQPQMQISPAFQDVVPGQNATISVTTSGSPVSYQWVRTPIGTRTSSILSDNGTYSGSATASLTIIGATTAMSGDQFQCVINYTGSIAVTSLPSSLVVDTPLVITTLAGAAGTIGLTNGNGTGASFAYPSGVALDSSGNIYVADYNNNEIREVTPSGMVTTPYGSLAGTAGSANGSGNSATFDTPNGVAVDGSGNIYVADTTNNLIRKITAGSVTTFAGAGGTLFNLPQAVAVDGTGNVYVADTSNDVIREITPGGTVSILAGQVGNAGYEDGAATTQALFKMPSGVAVDSSGTNIYVADFGNSVVRKISGGVVSTIAGQPDVSGYIDGPGLTALFNAPTGIAVDSANNLYVTDGLVPPIGSTAGGNDVLRKVNPAGVVSTLAGLPGQEGTSNGIGNAAQFYSLQAVALNPTTGTFYLADTYNQTIRAGTLLPPPTITLTTTQPNAMVFGPTPGQFTVTRTGPTTGDLTVDYSTGGSAISGTDFTPLPGYVTFPAGASSTTITVNPVADLTAASSPTLQLSLTGTNGYTIGNPNSGTVTIMESTLFQTWETNEFGANATVPGIEGATSDPNHNGVPNLLEYAFNSNPLQGGTEPFPVLSYVQDGSGNQYLALTFTELNNDPNLTYIVQVTSDLSQKTDQWHSGPAYTSVVSQTVNGNTTQITVQDNTPFTTTTKRFIRVVVSGN